MSSYSLLLVCLCTWTHWSPIIPTQMLPTVTRQYTHTRARAQFCVDNTSVSCVYFHLVETRMLILRLRQAPALACRILCCSANLLSRKLTLRCLECLGSRLGVRTPLILVFTLRRKIFCGKYKTIGWMSQAFIPESPFLHARISQSMCSLPGPFCIPVSSTA